MRPSDCPHRRRLGCQLTGLCFSWAGCGAGHRPSHRRRRSAALAPRSSPAPGSRRHGLREPRRRLATSDARDSRSRGRSPGHSPGERHAPMQSTVPYLEGCHGRRGRSSRHPPHPPRRRGVAEGKETPSGTREKPSHLLVTISPRVKPPRSIQQTPLHPASARVTTPRRGGPPPPTRPPLPGAPHKSRGARAVVTISWPRSGQVSGLRSRDRLWRYLCCSRCVPGGPAPPCGARRASDLAADPRGGGGDRRAEGGRRKKIVSSGLRACVRLAAMTCTLTSGPSGLPLPAC